MIKILFTGVGRRVELIQAFRQAALVLNKELKIYGADCARTAPALAFCDYSRQVCGMKEEGYVDELSNICKEDGIDLLIPTIDTDLLVLSRNKKKFENTRILISSPDMVFICRDKNLTTDFFISCGLETPKTVNKIFDYTEEFPCFIKPKDGSSSINAFKVKNRKELEMYCEIVGDYIIQSFVDGIEYTVDIFCDFDGKPVYITPRKRLQVRAGEVLKTEIDLDKRIIEECGRIIEKFKPCGPLTVQLIRDFNNVDHFIEINPRYGGGAPLSMKAGARSAESVLLLLSGENITVNPVDNGAVYSRFEQSVCIKEGDRQQPIKGVVFDIDDTLYSEKDYVKSGYRAVAQYLGNENAAEKLWDFFVQGKPAIDFYLESIKKIEEKEKCLEVYRNHKPDIHLYSGVFELIEELKKHNIKVGIITDGRSNGQRNKIEALGLKKIIDEMNIVITDELGGVQFRKPNINAFQLMKNKWKLPYESIVYIGDNADKDFQAVKQLGMRWIWFDNKDGLYKENYRIELAINSVDSVDKIIDKII